MGTHATVYFGCFSDAHAWGGALTFARGVQRAFGHRGSTTRIIGVTGKETTRSETATALNLFLPAQSLIWRARSWSMAHQLARRLRDLQPPNILVALSAYWVCAAKRAWPGVPVVFKVPCILANCLPCTWTDRRPPTVWKRLELAGVRHVEQVALRQADLVVVPTLAARNEVAACAPNVERRLETCSYGVAHAAIDNATRQALRHNLGFSDPDLVFLLAGVCDANKDFGYALRIWLHVQPRGKLLIVGDGPQRPDLQRQIAHFGLGRRVRLVGAQPAIGRWLAAADAVLSTSQYDMYPNTIQEGFARGLPALVPRHDPPKVYAGLAEVIVNHGGGLLYERRQPPALADACNVLCADRVLYRQLQQEAREIAARRGGYERFVEILERHLHPADATQNELAAALATLPPAM